MKSMPNVTVQTKTRKLILYICRMLPANMLLKCNISCHVTHVMLSIGSCRVEENKSKGSVILIKNNVVSYCSCVEADRLKKMFCHSRDHKNIAQH